MDIDDENIQSGKCFRCGAIFDIKWRKRKINGKWGGKWDGETYFCNACNFRRGRVLTDKQKIVILALIETRSFSNISCVDIRKEEVRKELKHIIDITYEKLKEWDLIKLKIDDLYDMSGIEDPIANLFRIAFNDLQDKTIGFAKHDNRVYYLDVFDERLEIFKDNINSLFRLTIYGKEVIKNEEMNCVQVSDKNKNDIFNYSEELCSLCIDISDSKSAYIFNNIYEHIFSSPKYDNIMSDIIKYL